jgi:sugar phosphate isomerase/epimerase
LVEALLELRGQHAITYNIHLPIDRQLGHPDPIVRNRDCRVLQEMIHQLATLNPTAYVLHLEPPDEAGPGLESLRSWQEGAGDSLARILDSGLPGERLALENLLFPFEWLDPLLARFDLGVCLDTGHLALQQGDLETFLANYGSRITVSHLHGIENGRDHQSLEGLPPDDRWVLTPWLQEFTGTVSLEVFDYTNLEKSLACLDRMMTAPG